MKTNDKDIERTSVTPHAVERGYTVPLVEVGDEMDIDNLINSQIC